MTLNFVPLAHPSRDNLHLIQKLVAELTDFVGGESFVLGSAVVEFERSLAHFVKRKFAIGVANGTDAITLSLAALGIQPGDRVAIMPNAGGYSLTACLGLGLTPTFFDCGPNGQASIGLLSKHIKDLINKGKKPRAVVVTNLWGGSGDLPEIESFLLDNDIPLIEDNAQGLGGFDSSKSPLGSRGLLSTFSFYPTKTLGALGDGGAIAVDDSDLAQRLVALRQYGWTKKYEIGLKGGQNSRLDELQARFLLAKLQDLPGHTARRLDILDVYSRALRRPEALISYVSGFESGHLAVLDASVLGLKRAEAVRQMESHGVAWGIHYPILDPEQPVVSGMGLEQDRLSNARNLVQSILTIPLFLQMSDQEISSVARALEGL